MDQDSQLITAMAEQCRTLIQNSPQNTPELPFSLQRQHLLWMCNQIENHAEQWRVSKLHRWIGFIQAGMLANKMLDLDSAKAMFAEAKAAYRVEADEDLVDHLNPSSSFELDLGGQG